MIEVPCYGAPDEPFMEGWAVLSALAAVTSRIRLVTLACSVAFRNPAHLAKIAATVDVNPRVDAPALRRPSGRSGSSSWVRSVLSRERDDPAGAFNAEAREVLVRELLRADPALRVHNHAVGQDSRALDDRLAGNLARNPFNVGAVGPVYLSRVAHDDSSGAGCGLYHME
jgi:hypothetical protein